MPLSALAAVLLCRPSLQAVDLQSVAGTDTKLKVYGFVRVDATYYADSLQNSRVPPPRPCSTTPATRPTPAAQPTQNLVFGYAPSRLGFTSITPSANLGDITTKIEMDMNTAPWHTRLVQISIGNWTVGKAWSVWNDLDAGPDTVDWAGPVGGACFDTPRRPLVKDLAHFDKKNSLEIGIEQNSGQTDGTTAGAASKADGRYPNFVAAYTYADTWGHIGLRGLEQNVAAYIPTATTASSRYNSWEGAFQLSGAFNIAKDALVATIYSGKALGDYGTGIQAAGAQRHHPDRIRLQDHGLDGRLHPQLDRRRPLQHRPERRVLQLRTPSFPPPPSRACRAATSTPSSSSPRASSWAWNTSTRPPRPSAPSPPWTPMATPPTRTPAARWKSA